DVRFAIRHLARTPLTTATIVLVLSLGIGFNAALVSLVRALTTRSAPGIDAANDLVRIRGTERLSAGQQLFPRGLTVREVEALRDERARFTSVAAWADADVVIDLGDPAASAFP